MAQALLLGAGGFSAITCRSPSMRLICAPLQYGQSSNSIISRNKLDVEHLLLKGDRVALFSGASRAKHSLRLQLSAVAELQLTALAEQAPESSALATTGLPRGADFQLDNAATSVGQSASQSLDASPQLLNTPPSYPATIEAPNPLPENVPVGPELKFLEPSTNPVLPSVDAASIQTPSAESAVISSPNVVESLGQSGTDVLKAAGEAGVTSETTNALDVTKAYSLPDSIVNSQNSFNEASKGAVNAVGETTSSITNTMTAAQDAVTKTINNILDAVRDSVGSAGNAVRDVYDGFNGSKNSAISSVTGIYDKTVEDIQTSVDSTVTKAGEEVAGLTSVFRMGTPLNNSLKEVVVVVKGAAGSALEASGRVLSEVYASTWVLLPPRAQSYLSVAEEKVHEISGPLGTLLQQVYGGVENVEKAVGVDPENPIIPVLLVVGGSLYFGVSYWQSRYGGYSGDLMPTSALDLLKKERNVVLVDIRPQELREIQGVPDLRRGARAKVAAVEVVQVEGSMRNKLKNSKEIDSILTAAIIRNLKNVKPNSKVIVMDADGSESKEVARALRRFGLKRRYRVEGGFQAWTAAGLRSKAEGMENPISILKEDTEEIVAEAKPTADGVLLVALGLVAGVYAAFEWEKALQLLGVIGTGQAIYSRVNTYDSVEDVKADLRSFQRPFTVLGERILWAVGQMEPAKLQLVTSPSTSAVQDRVLQAAAKHGPLVSEQSEEAEVETQAEAESVVETPLYSPTGESVPIEGGPEEIPPPPVLE